MLELLDGVTSNLLNKALDRSALEHKLIANNIANSSTVGFIPQTTAFGQTLATIQNLVEQNATPASLRDATENWNPQQDIGTESGYTQVELDREMVKLTQNTLHYQALMTAKSGLGDLLRTAIKEGKG
ncbi:flagellar basal body rod protein FlgB [Parendozoicomonas haliclonae]|uniref:Flagellar basal body rod protein FlgB n=1 Tax=Parendozoicomonas haliclonae TaxID=1960125 RepID=A0A1X7AP68_9GAMM|nr:flagellar basal body protein [Parendozoicomonas haliclonae]SMA49879.1 Flagellar basal body rod protein FlgB [Parendozoicomonas haliclonae]